VVAVVAVVAAAGVGRFAASTIVAVVDGKFLRVI
jgi:hypothetical protein